MEVLDNLQDRPLRGTTDWTEAANVLDVGEDAASVHFGVLLAGAGRWTLPGRVSRSSVPTCPSPGSRGGRWHPSLRASTSALRDTGAS
jgi:hypothetical protein